MCGCLEGQTDTRVRGPGPFMCIGRIQLRRRFVAEVVVVLVREL